MAFDLYDWELKPDVIIGRGTFGVVCDARAKNGAEYNAVAKIFDSNESAPEFFDEVYSLQMMKGVVGVPEIYNYGIINGKPTIIMQKITGERLHDIVKKRKSSNAETKSYIKQLLLILKTAHQIGLIHRDIKPGNIIISGGLLYLIDWGAAGAVNNGRCFWPVGTRAYTAPEIFNGFNGVEADFYSLGWVIAYMVSGEQPYQTRLIKENDYRLVAACLERPELDREALGQWYYLVKALVNKRPGERPVSYDLDALMESAKLIGSSEFVEGASIPAFMPNDYYLGLAANENVLFAQDMMGWRAMERGEYDAAAYWFRRSAKLGYPRSQYGIGYGILRKKIKPMNDHEAFYYLMKGSESGHPLCQYWLGMYWKDKKNVDEAMVWIKRSAVNGYPYAQYYLGKMLIQNSDGNGWWWIRVANVMGSKSAKKFIDQYALESKSK